MRELFIYWRVAAARADAALVATAQFQATQRALHAGLRTALYRRNGEAAGTTVTVMETYAMSGASSGAALVEVGVDLALQATLIDAAALALAKWCEDQRNVEAFDLVSPPR